MIAHTQDMLRLARPEDMDAVRAILTDPDVAPTFGAIPDDLDSFAIFIAKGIVIGAEVRTDSVYLHLAIQPFARGRRAIAAVRGLTQWFFENTDCQRVCGWSRTEHRANVMFNRMCGARPRGRVRDRTLFAVTRAEYERRVT